MNGEYVRYILLHPDASLDYITNYIYTVTDGIQSSEYRVLPEQAMFLILFHHLCFLGCIHGAKLATFSDGFEQRFQALQTQLPMDATSDVFGIQSKLLESYITSLLEDFQSSRLTTWKDALSFFKDTPANMLQTFKKAIESRIVYKGEEKGEEKEDTAVREVKEEVGADAEIIEPVAPVIPVLPVGPVPPVCKLTSVSKGVTDGFIIILSELEGSKLITALSDVVDGFIIILSTSDGVILIVTSSSIRVNQIQLANYPSNKFF